jgi:hypothetical protein
MVAKKTVGSKGHPRGNRNFFFEAGGWGRRDQRVVTVSSGCLIRFYKTIFQCQKKGGAAIWFDNRARVTGLVLLLNVTGFASEARAWFCF